MIRMKPMARTKERPIRVLRPAMMGEFVGFEDVAGDGAGYGGVGCSLGGSLLMC